MTRPIAAERGLVVGARYRLESVLGEGGMAVVWSAVHTETDRRVALKLVRPELVTNEPIREMFVREARVAARIGRCENIVDVLDAGVDPALQVPFIAMELLEGEGMDARIKKGPIERQLAADLLEQLGDALDQAHGAGVFHRDLKPQNLFLGLDRKKRPQLKVLDFGIAKLSESTLQSTTHVGTPAYAAPEQLGDSWRSIAKGRQKNIAEHVSLGTDIWALGLIAYEMLTGAQSGAFWGAKTLAELPVKIVLEPLPLASAQPNGKLLPPGFDAWMARCLDLDAKARWPSAREAVATVVMALRGGAVRPKTASVPMVAPTPAPIPTPFASGPPLGSAPPGGPPPGTAPPGGCWAAPAPQAPPAPSPPAPIAPPMPVAGVDPRLNAWAAHRRAELRSPGDVHAFRAWPVTYLPPVEHVSQQVRLPLPNAMVTIGDFVSSDAFRKAVGEDRMLVAIVQSPRLAFRAAIRSKRSSGGVVDGVSRGLKALDALIAPQPTMGILRDPQFEQHYEVWAPTPQEAFNAVPIPLRQLLLTGGFHGIIERYPSAFVITSFDLRRFDPSELDRLLDACTRILGAIP